MTDLDKLRLIFGESITVNTIELMRIEFSKFSENIKITEQEYIFDVKNNPFFIQPKTVAIDIHAHPNLDLYVSSLNKLDTLVVFNQWLMMTYVLSGSPNRAIAIREWTLYSLNQTIKNIMQLTEENSTITWTNIGHRYMGLGHVEVLRMDIESGDLFIQPDGGSNGYERVDYWEMYKNQKINKEQTIDFTTFVSK
jgi:hypothetical protein